LSLATHAYNTTTAATTGWKYSGISVYAGLYQFNGTNGQHQWFNAPSGSANAAISFTQAMTLTAGGLLGIGQTSPVANLDIKDNVSDNASIGLQSGTSQKFYITAGISGVSGNIFSIGRNSGGTTPDLALSGGNLLVGTTSGSTHSIDKSIENDYALNIRNTASANNFGVAVRYPNSSPNTASNQFLICTDSTANRIILNSNGGISNYSANNVNLSDRREKTNFAPATSYLDKICAIPVQTFNYIDQNLEEDGGLTLGVVAQDVQAVAPELVTEGNWGTQEEPKMRLSIYQTDLQYALMKCIQEQQAIIESLKARLDAANL
jgi:hypothetical protein